MSWSLNMGSAGFLAKVFQPSFILPFPINVSIYTLMTKPNYSGIHGNENNLFSPIQRLYGSKMYSADLDTVWYKYENNEPKPVACVDYKHGNMGKVTSDTSACHLRQVIARELKVPLFIILYWLEPLQVPQYFVIPANRQAANLITLQGVWMTPRAFCFWQHQLRGIQLNKFEQVPKKDNPWPHIEILDDLPDENFCYQLPTIEIILK